MKRISDRNRLILLLGLCLCLLFSQLLTTAAAEQTATITSADGILRLHILANSDSDIDQDIKLEVRDAVLPYFEAANSYEDARSFLLQHGDQVQSICEQALKDCGAGYGAYLQLGTESFPDRTYEGTLYPAGEYDALVIVLGNGGGHNWWCVLYPPLCIVTPDGEIVDTEELDFESDLWDWIKDVWARWF
ncbi:MAG: stage II sporulation protein R [Eubacteriales bacterium]|nr:stage II sporulation protein R [Eubacteriales bacterium]